MARPRRRLGNLSAETTSFIGRRRELAEVRRRLASARLVSLVGPGGVGKTRLAVRAATDLGRGFRAGAWLVELAEVRDPALFYDAVLSALDLRAQGASDPRPVLLQHLRDKELLLVLDNCEHLLTVVAEAVAVVLSEGPGVRILATSREPLSVAGEYVVPVPPLELPAAGRTESPAELGQNESVALFVERAAAAAGKFELGEAQSTDVAAICRRLDGLPLALELAAGRTRVLSVAQINERLNDRFRLLVGASRAALPRHQTLETAIDWSYDLLSGEERVLLRRLCVFAGRFVLEDVESVCLDGTGGDALALMSSLVDKSLVVKEEAGRAAAYRLHETMREYASRKLDESGDRDAAEERFIEHYVVGAQAVAMQARFALIEWLGGVELEIDNIRAVLRQCLDRGDIARGTILATSLGWYWVNRAASEGARWLDELHSSPAGDPDTLAWSYFMRGFLGVVQGDWVNARPALEKAIAIARDSDLPVQLVNSLSMSSIAENIAGDHAAGLTRLAEAAAIPIAPGDVPSRVSVLQARSLNGVFEGDPEAIRIAATEGERLSREIGDLYARHMMLLNLGGAALMAGDLIESRQRYEQGLPIAYEMDDRIGEAYMINALAFHAALAGRHVIAARLNGAAETIRASVGAVMLPALAPFIAMTEDSATDALGVARYAREVEAGRALDRHAAVRLALGQSEKVEERREGDAGTALGERQLEVARLVAEGLSNKQIATRLFLSQRTIDSHVRTILNKLGFNSRAQIAGWVATLD